MKKKQRIEIESLPFDVQDSLANFGEKIAIARRARLYTQADFAARVGVGLNTMIAIEKGSPSVQFGSYVMCLWALNMLTEFEEIARPDRDSVAIGEGLRRIPRIVR